MLKYDDGIPVERWVVVDPALNKEHIKIYCAPDSTGSILEPNGLCNVKQKVFKGHESFENNKVAQQLYATLHNKPECLYIDHIVTYEEFKKLL